MFTKPDNLISGFASTDVFWPISAPKMRAREELHVDGCLKNGSVPSKPVWLTLGQDLRTKVVFL